jgi:hypothetical protein
MRGVNLGCDPGATSLLSSLLSQPPTGAKQGEVVGWKEDEVSDTRHLKHFAVPDASSELKKAKCRKYNE